MGEWVHGQGAHLNKVSELVHEASALAPGHSGPGSLVKGLHMHLASEAAYRRALPHVLWPQLGLSSAFPQEKECFASREQSSCSKISM